MPTKSTRCSERNDQVRDPKRREFLRAIPAIPLAGLGVVLPGKAAATDLTGANGNREPVYRETELIARYYERARF